ncbi:MAG: PilZ domain-containing protein [Myxococcales bacterium]|nr:PilZ domain-containing protein [Myxococcales bacterium]
MILDVSTDVNGPGNHRETARIKVDAFVKVSGGNDREYVFRTRDLSDGGLFLYTKVTHIYPIKIGSRLTLELYDYDDYIACTVVVVRVVEPGSEESEQYPTGFGVKIAEIDETNRERLESMLERLGDGVAPY